MKTWSPKKLERFSIKQQPTYNDLVTLKQVEKELASYPSTYFCRRGFKS